LARLQSLSEASDSATAAEQVASSQANVFNAELHHAGLGEALVAQRAAQRTSATAREEGAQLSVATPTAGVVATVDPENLVNREVTTGETLLTIVDPSQLVARLFVPASEMDRIRVGDPVSLQLPSQFREIRGRLGPMEGSAVPLPPGVLANQVYKGMALPAVYTARMPMEALDNSMRAGMTGQAKIFGRRRSIADRMGIMLGNLLHTHFW
jgi:multidrug resistance efflux pump